jgi:hypothetical protein
MTERDTNDVIRECLWGIETNTQQAAPLNAVKPRIQSCLLFQIPHRFLRKIVCASSAPVVKVKLNLSLCLTKHHAMKTYRGSCSTAPRIRNLGTRRRWVFSFTPRPLYPMDKGYRFPLNSRLGGPQSRPRRGGKDKRSQHCILSEQFYTHSHTPM